MGHVMVPWHDSEMFRINQESAQIALLNNAQYIMLEIHGLSKPYIAIPCLAWRCLKSQRFLDGSPMSAAPPKLILRSLQSWLCLQKMAAWCRNTRQIGKPISQGFGCDALAARKVQWTYMNKSKIETKHAKRSWKLKIKRINNYIDTIQKGIRTPNSKKNAKCVCVFF